MHASHGNRVNPFVNRKPLEGGGRKPFMERVRKGLGHPSDRSPPPAELPPTRDEAVIRQVAADDPGRVDRFARLAYANKATVKRLPADAGAILAAIDECFAAHKIVRCIENARELGAQFGVAAHLAGKGIRVLEWGSPNCAAEAFHCDASITDARAGLADTGAMLVWSDKTFGRSTTLVVPVHITLLPASRILGDMIDGFDLALKENGGELPSNVVVINGPSKTADIEMNLVTGVHGPKYLHIFIIDGM